MMFVHDAPSAVNLAQAHGQTKLQRFQLAVRIETDAPPYGRSEGNIFPAVDSHVVKIKGDRFFRRREKRLPCRHIGIQTL
jgi:hypothetical protein